MTDSERLIRLDEKVSGRGGLIDLIMAMQQAVSDQQNKIDARVIVLETFRQTKAADETINRWNNAADFAEAVKRDYSNIQATVDWHKSVMTNWKLITLIVSLVFTFISPLVGLLITQVVWPAIRGSL